MLVVRRTKTDWKYLYTFAILLPKFSGIWIKIEYVDIQRSSKWWSGKGLLDIQNVGGAVSTCAKSTVIVLFLLSDWDMLFSYEKVAQNQEHFPSLPHSTEQSELLWTRYDDWAESKLKNTTMWLLSLAMSHSNVPKDNNILLSCFKFCFWLKYN